MTSVCVVIAKTSTGMYWDSIEQLLGDDPEIDVYVTRSGWTLKRNIRRFQPQVLILEKTGKDIEGKYQKYLKEAPGLAIIILDPLGSDTFVGLNDIGSSELLQLIKTISWNNEDQTIHYVDLNIAEESSTKSPQAIQAEYAESTQKNTQDFIGPYRQDQEHLNEVLRWLDLILLQALSQEDDSGNQFSAPGWAMNVDQARALIGTELVAARESVIRSARIDLENKISQRERLTQPSINHIKLLWLFVQFGLNQQERMILLLVLAPELDAKYASIFGFLNDNLTKRWPTTTLLARLFDDPDLDALRMQYRLHQEGAIARYGLVLFDKDPSLSISDQSLRPARELFAFLTSKMATGSYFGSELELMTGCLPRTNDFNVDQFSSDELKAWWRITNNDQQGQILQLSGVGDVVSWFTNLFSDCGLPVLILDLSKASQQGREDLAQLALGASRVAMLYQATLLVVGLDIIRGKSVPEWVQVEIITRLSETVPRLAIHSEFVFSFPESVRVNRLDRATRTQDESANAWRYTAENIGFILPSNYAKTLANSFRFDVLQMVKTFGLWQRNGGDEELDLKSLQQAARIVARGDPPSAVKRVDTTFGWEDIVLLESTIDKLKSIPTHVCYSDKVFETWGFKNRMPYGRSIAALFTGVSGTGKTMASQIIAADLGVDLFQVDLAKTVSKYIGETEKNLDVVFEAAEKSSAVLLFDEADALFGKRTEVRDAHDRYANVEVAYLLQRIESFTGLVILTTNFRRNLDAAFMRRMRFVIKFEAPDYRERLAIWERVFPQEAMAQFEQKIDFNFLAKRLELTGGNIQQIAVRAAFAAAEGGVITMQHIVNATREEMQKLGMSNAEQTLKLIAA